MDKYPRMFIISSIVYLVAGTFWGHMMAVGALDSGSRFVHVHLNLAGFMSMMVFGVAYHILPRFMGQQVKWPVLVPVHYYVANLSLLVMIITYMMGGYFSSDGGAVKRIFEISTGFAFLSAILFALNIIPAVLPPRRKAIIKPAADGPKKSDKEAPVITGDMKIGEILEIRPETLNVFIAAGFKGFENPETRKSFGEKLVLKTACQIRSLDLEELLNKLNGPVTEETINAAQNAPPLEPKKQLSIKRGDLITLKTPIGDMVEVYPETKKVLEDNYGGECFTCPGMAIETVEETANMHNKKPEDILSQINGIVRDALKS